MPNPALNPLLSEREFIFCEGQLPVRCLHCESYLEPPGQYSLMMINEQGEAVVCQGPVVLCPGCKAAYAQEAHYARIAQQFEFNPYLLVGFMDLDAIPEDQRDQPLGEDPDAELPLLEFASFQPLRKAQFD